MDQQKFLVNPIAPEFQDHLDKQFVEIYTRYQAPKVRADQVDIQEYRANPTTYTFPITPGPKPEVGQVKQFAINVHKPSGQILVQVYTPDLGDGAEGKMPVHLNFHGGKTFRGKLPHPRLTAGTGGWVIGSLKSDEAWCRQVCRAISIVVVDVDYRLAPEYPYPTQIWDAWAALQWLLAEDIQAKLNIDKNRISVGGLSAGGNIAAVLAIMARDAPEVPPLKLQLLTVPTVDVRSIPVRGKFDHTLLPHYQTYHTCEHAPCLPLERMVWFCKHWLGDDEEQRKTKAEQWMASPMAAASHEGLPPASIHCAEFDVLRSEGEAYHCKLRKAGVLSTYKEYSGVAHPFGRWDGGLDKGKEYVHDTITALRNAHGL